MAVKCFHKFEGSERSHSDIVCKGLAVTNKGRMPYQKIPPDTIEAGP